MLRGLSAAERVLRGERVVAPGSDQTVMGFVILFLVIVSSLISYFRGGTSSRSYRCWSCLLSATATALTFVLRRGVELSSGLSSGGESDQQRDRLVRGQW